MKTLSHSALDYRKRGLSVIPLKPRSKEALHEWKAYQKKKATEAQIKSWWKKSPRANCGIVTGKVSGIVVIDCDSDEASERFEKDYPEAAETFQSSTGRGKHFFFKWAPRIHNHAGTILGQGIDVKSDGGYVVAAPSIHPNGKAYKWLNENATQALSKTQRRHSPVHERRL